MLVKGSYIMTGHLVLLFVIEKHVHQRFIWDMTYDEQVPRDKISESTWLLHLIEEGKTISNSQTLKQDKFWLEIW